ncbi:MAG: cyclodeaminase/cyclohydrolase family protein [Clostridia bacterium]|nr:cyclodeaminase/cyclohydrolase family protein [Clostridia bacterium]
MSMLDKSCKEFIEVLASKAPVPGGGGAAALGGAVGMALTNMVGNLTVGKKKYADVEDEVKQLLEQGYKVIADLEILVDKDAEVFEPLSKAYGLPKDTPEQAKYREETLENLGKVACSVPMGIMRASYDGIKLTARMAEIGSMLVLSDAACGVVFLKAALIAASMNVIININSIQDQEYVKQTKEEMDRLLAEGTKLADDTLKLVTDKLTK